MMIIMITIIITITASLSLSLFHHGSELLRLPNTSLCLARVALTLLLTYMFKLPHCTLLIYLSVSLCVAVW